MANMNIDTEKLLSDQRVVDEIRRHLWIESEKAGYDIGFEKAKQDWLEKFSKAWMTYNMPDALIKARKAAADNDNRVVEAKDKSSPSLRYLISGTSRRFLPRNFPVSVWWLASTRCWPRSGSANGRCS